MPVYSFLDVIGGHLIMVGRAFAWLPRRPFRGRNYLEAMEYIGFGSLPIVLLVGAFTGDGDVAAVGQRVPHVRLRVVLRRRDRQGARASSSGRC